MVGRVTKPEHGRTFFPRCADSTPVSTYGDSKLLILNNFLEAAFIICRAQGRTKNRSPRTLCLDIYKL